MIREPARRVEAGRRDRRHPGERQVAALGQAQRDAAAERVAGDDDVGAAGLGAEVRDGVARRRRRAGPAPAPGGSGVAGAEAGQVHGQRAAAGRASGRAPPATCRPSRRSRAAGPPAARRPRAPARGSGRRRASRRCSTSGCIGIILPRAAAPAPAVVRAPGGVARGAAGVRCGRRSRGSGDHVRERGRAGADPAPRRRRRRAGCRPARR